MRWRKRAPGAARVARHALRQHALVLKQQFPQIVSLSDAAVPGSRGRRYVLTIYLSNHEVSGLPESLPVRLPDGRSALIGTEIIPGLGTGSVHICQQDGICCNTDKPGSICCLVHNRQGDRLLVTAGHIYSSGSMRNYGGDLDATQQLNMLANGAISGTWVFQQIDWVNDIALARVDPFQEDPALISFAAKGYYEVGSSDVGHTCVRLVSNSSEPRVRDAFILDYNTSWDIEYADGWDVRNNVVVVGSTADRKTSQTVSRGGDSGGCVFEPVSGKLVGLIVGGNDRYTWVLPVRTLLESRKYVLA